MGSVAVVTAFAEINAALAVLAAEVAEAGSMPFSAADPLRGLADGCLDVLSGVAGTEGRLAALKVIDPEAADRALTREALVWGGRYSTIMVAAAFESWVRLWEARLKPPL